MVSNKTRHLPDTLRPDVLVQACIDTNILGAHLLFGEFADFFDGAWGTLLETDIVYAFRQMDGTFAGHNLVDRRFVSFFNFWFGHF